MTDLVRTCAWCPPGAARAATAACPRCGRPTCDQHRVRQSTPPSRCDECEAEYRARVNSPRQLGITVAWLVAPLVGGSVLMAIGHTILGAAVGGFGTIAGILLRSWQRRLGSMRRRFLAERADLLPPARVVDRPPPDA